MYQNNQTTKQLNYVQYFTLQQKERMLNNPGHVIFFKFILSDESYRKGHCK